MQKEMKQTRYLMLDQPAEGQESRWMHLAYKGMAMLYQWAWRISPKKRDIAERQYKVSIGAIFKNEALYLKEWIEFHRIVGVEHFYLYNNNSDDNYLDVLAPYIKRNIVTLVDWPKNQAQIEAYKDCIHKYAKETRWMGFVDIDEFVVPRKTDNIYDFLQAFENKYGAVKLYWRMYGTSGHMERDVKGLVTEDFTVCWSKYYDVGKCFYNTAFGFDEKSPKNDYLHHNLWTNNGGRNFPPVNIFGKVCFGDVNVIPTAEFPIQINHYFTKSYQEYAWKRAKGDVYFKVNPHDEEYFYNHEKWCEATDYAAYRYLIKLKHAMAQGQQPVSAEDEQEI